MYINRENPRIMFTTKDEVKKWIDKNFSTDDFADFLDYRKVVCYLFGQEESFSLFTASSILNEAYDKIIENEFKQEEVFINDTVFRRNKND